MFQSPLKIRPPGQFSIPIPPRAPAVEPDRAGNHDADRAPNNGAERQQKTEAVNAQGPDRIADEIAEVGVLVIRRANGLALAGVHRGQDQRAVQCQGKQVVKKKVIAIICAGL